MRQRMRYLVVALGLFSLTLVLKASLPQPTGTWSSGGAMASLHDGGCSVLLQDGRIAVMGGAGSNGPVANIDIFSTSGIWSPGAPMGSARTHQDCVVLQGGQVLVTGGDSGAGAINTAELYDPVANSWSALPLMTQARSHATASLLQDGRVLIAGGADSNGNPSNSLEIFDPNAKSFTFAGAMSASRQDAAAAVLQDGRVLIVGGCCSTDPGTGSQTVLASSDIYDPVSTSVSAGPILNTGRMKHSATTQLDGKVSVIGGSNGTSDLGSIEVFDPSVGSFSSIASLQTPRSGHLAFLMPKNNQVLVVGGQSAGTDLGSAELYTPWSSNVQSTGSLATARSQASGVPLSIVGGLLMVAGGSSQASAELYSFATVKTDQGDYSPGSTVTITGTGWQPGETVTLTFVESPLIDTHPPLYAVADQNGNIFNNQFSPDSHDVNVRFYLTATGPQSQAQTSFTDNISINGATINVDKSDCATPDTEFSQGNTVCSNVGVTTNGNNGSASFFVVWFNPSNVIVAQHSKTVTGSTTVTDSLSTTASSPTGTWTVKTCDSNSCSTTSGNKIYDSKTFSLAGTAAKYLVSSNNNSPIAGAAVTITAQLADSAGNPVPVSGRVVTWSKIGNGGSFSLGTGTTDVNGLVSVIFTTGTSVTTYTVTATDGGGLTGNVSFSTVPGIPSAGTSTVRPNPISVVADGTTSSTITVTLLDANTNPVSGKTVTLSAGSGSSTISAASGPSNANGVVTFTVTDTTVESVTYTAKDTTDNVTVGQTAAVSFTVGQVSATTSTVTASPTTVDADGSTSSTIPVTLKDASGHPVSGKTVSLSQASGSSRISPASGTSNLSGVVTFTVTDTKAETVTYSATDSTDSITLTQTASVTFADTVSAAKSSVTANPISVPADNTTKATITVTLNDYSGNPVSGKHVVVNSPGSNATVATVNGTTSSNGQATFTVADSVAETVTLTAKDQTDNNLQIGTANVTFTAVATSVNITSSVNPSVFGQPVTFTATVAPTSGSTGPTGSVQFAVDGTNLGSPVSLTASGATGTAQTSALSNLSVSNLHTISATYTPNTGNFTGNSGSVSQKVSKADSLSTVTSSANPSTYGQTVTFAATVTAVAPGAGTPTGTITFMDGTNTLASNVSLNSGSASYTAQTPLSAGSHTITAVYSGDGNFNATGADSGSTDPALAQTVGKTSSSTAVTSSLNPTTYGQMVTFTATVSSSGGTPTGSVTFYDGGNSLGAGALTSGVAIFSISTLTAGTHSITAGYGGDANFNGSTSTSVSQGVSRANPTITWARPAAIAYGTALGATQLDATANIPGTFVYNPAAGTILNAGTQNLSTTFTPTDTTDYNTAAASVSISVLKATPVITWATPAAITYGTALSTTQLDATANVAGTFVYAPAAGTVLSAGNNQALSVSFTPADTQDYNTASATVLINVLQAMPIITWPAPSPINYPTPLSSLQLAATANVPGTLTYNPAAGQVLTVGSWQLSVSFTPTDNVDYMTASAQVPISVNPGTVTITWNNPADITYGTALSSTQLDATASVAGTFAYNPPAGTVLPAGSQQPLVTLFTPTDPNYSSNSATVYLNVNKAAPTIVWSNPADITYGTALSDTQLKAVAVPTYAATARWNADGDTNDLVGNNNGTPVGNVTYVVGETGQQGDQAFSLDGASGITVPYNSGFDIKLPGFTADFWVKGNTTQLGAQNGLVTLLEKSPDYANFNGWTLQADAASGVAKFSIGNGTSFTTVSGGNVLDGNWHFVLATWDGTAMALYVDGTASAPASVTPANNLGEVAIGFDPAISNQYFNGALDNIEIDDQPIPQGDYAYTPAAGEVLSAGDGQQLSVMFNPRDTADLKSASVNVTINVNKAKASITVTPYDVTYDGNPRTASGTATGVNGENLAGLDLSGTSHTAAGDYASDPWTFTDSTGNYQNDSGTVHDQIGKANANITVTGYSVTYDGNAHSATGTVTGIGGVALSGLDLSATTHTNAGNYTDGWTFTDSTGNYNNGSGNVSDVIARATATISVTPYSVTYDGNTHTATGSVTGVSGEALSGLDLSKTTHTNAGDYSNDPWTFVDSTGNYNNASGTVHDAIAKANATITVAPYSLTYDGNAHTATGTATGVKGEMLSGLDLGGTTHTNAGTYTNDGWSFKDSTGNYNDASGMVSDVIAKANPAISVTPYSVIYDGNVHTATGSITGVKSEALSGLDLSGTNHTNAADYPSDKWVFTDSTGNYNDASGTVHDAIARANAVVNVAPYSVTYDGDFHTATGTATGVKGEALGGLDLSGTKHTAAGTYANDPWTLTDTTGNYNNASGTVSDAIAKANPSVTVTPFSVTYDGNAHTATGMVTGVKGETLSGLDLSGTTHTTAGDYAVDAWTFTDSTGNYNNANGTVHDQIAKANATINVAGYIVTYDGNAHSANGSATGVKGEALSGLNLTGTIHTSAGSFNDTWTFTDTSGNYNNADGPVVDSIAKANAAVSVTPYSVTYDGNAHTATGTITGVKGESLSGLDLSGTTHTNAGTYTDSWVFTDSTGNYNNASGSVTDSVAKANATVSVVQYTSLTVTYDGNPHTASGTATGVKGETLVGLNLSGTTHINAGDYPNDPWTFTDTTGNYSNVSGTVHDSIAKANARISVTLYSVTFDGTSHTATGTALGVKGESLSGLNLSGTTHTTAGSYTDGWVFTDVTGNYNNASGTVMDSIAKATPLVNWSNPANIIYGTALSGTQLNATASGVGGAALPGNFTYTPAAGTVLSPGAKPLNVSFAPNDTTDYVSPVTKAVTISVVFANGVTCNNGMASHVIQPPIAANGTTVVKKGSTVPTKFAVCDVNGNSVGPNAAFPSQNVVASYNIVSIWNGTLTNVDETLSSTTPDTAFRWDSTSQQWIFNTATGSGTNLNMSPATYGFQITLIDGSTITYQYGLK